MTAEEPAATRRDSGLVHGIGTLGLAANCIGVVIGAGIITIPRDIYAAVGPWAPAVYVAGALVMGAIGLCFAEASARAPASGGVYGFAAEAFGPFWGFQAGALSWASNVLAASGGAAAAADAATSIAPALAAGPARALAIAAWFALMIVVNCGGIGIASRFVSAATALKLVPLLVFIFVGATFATGANFHAPLSAGPGDFGRAAILGLFVFSGIEVGINVGGEVRSPARTIPRAIGLSMLVVVLVYIAIQCVAQGLLGPALATSKAPLVEALSRVSPLLGALMVAGALISILGFLAGDAMSSPRLLFAFARDGLMPAWLGRLHPASHAPWIAVCVHCLLCTALAISGSFGTLVAASTLCVVVTYAIGCAAALRLRARGIELAGPVTPLPALRPAALLAFVAMGWLSLQSNGLEATGIVALIAGVSLLYVFRRQPYAMPDRAVS